MRANKTSKTKHRTRQPQRVDYTKGVTFVFGDGSELFTEDPNMIKIIKTPALLNRIVQEVLERLEA